MTDEPVDLDERRGMRAQRETESRRDEIERLRADQLQVERRQEKLEELLLATPAESWAEVAPAALYLLQILAMTPAVLDDRRRRLIAMTINDLTRLIEQQDQAT